MSDFIFAATCVWYKECGILISGKPASGKSSLALSLIEKGARLVSDDITCLYIKNNALFANAPERTKGVLEVREIGLLSFPDYIQDIPVNILIQLDNKPQERGALNFNYTQIEGVKIPFFRFKMFDFSLTSKVITAIKLLNKEIVFFDDLAVEKKEK